MNLLNKIGLCAGFAAAMLWSGDSFAQNLQSVTNYASRHDELLARQSHIGEQIRLEETEQYANLLYEECEPEPDIYTEGWESGLVNSYKNAVVPDRAVIDVSDFVMPCPGIVTSPYGYRPRFRRMHKGVDLRAAIGDTIYAAFDGKVRLTKYERGGYGYYVIVRHTNGLETVYGHLSKFLVHPDETVKAGTPIALSGNTGRSFGPHLHFETRFMGYAINPAGIFDFANQTTHTDTYVFNKNTYQNARNFSPAANAEYARTYNAMRSANRAQASTPSRTKHSSGTSSRSVTVKKGDSLSKIAARNHTTVARLCRANGIKASTKIRPGQKLKIN